MVQATFSSEAPKMATPKEALHPSAHSTKDIPKLNLVQQICQRDNNLRYITTAAKHLEAKQKQENREQPSYEEQSISRLAQIISPEHPTVNWDDDPEAATAYALTAFSILSGSFTLNHQPEFITPQDIQIIRQKVHVDERKFVIRETPTNQRLKYNAKILTPDILAQEAEEHLQDDYLTIRAVMAPTEHKFFFEKGWLKDKLIQRSIRRESKQGSDRSWYQKLPFYNRWIIEQTQNHVFQAETAAGYDPSNPQSFRKLVHELHKKDAYSLINPDKQKLYSIEQEVLDQMTPEQRKLFEPEFLDKLFSDLDQKGHQVDNWQSINAYNEIASLIPGTTPLETITAFSQIYPEFKQKVSQSIQSQFPSLGLANNPTDEQIHTFISSLSPADRDALLSQLQVSFYSTLKDAPFIFQTDLAQKILNNKRETLIASFEQTQTTESIKIDLNSLSEQEFKNLSVGDLVGVIASENMAIDDLKQKMGNRRAKVNQALQHFKPYDDEIGWELKEGVIDAQYDQTLLNFTTNDFSVEINQTLQEIASSLSDEDPLVIRTFQILASTTYKTSSSSILTPRGLPAATEPALYHQVMGEAKLAVAKATNPEQAILKNLIKTSQDEYQNTHIKQSQLDALGVIPIICLSETGHLTEQSINSLAQPQDIKDILSDDQGTFTGRVNPSKLSAYLQAHPTSSLSLIAGSSIISEVIQAIFSQLTQDQQDEMSKLLNL